MSDKLKTAVITAGGSGMGAAAARRLAADGYKTAILSSSGKGEALAQELGGVGVTGSNQNNDDVQAVVDAAVNDLSLIAGQKPVVTVAKKAIAGFKIREGMPIGCKVTLRRDKMYEFLDRLVNFAIPRIRDFRGLSPKGFDGQGNYNMGMTEQIAFPEIDYDKIDKLRGLNISFTTTARTQEEGKALLAAFQFPFKN